jgi:cyclophilin family peptidyl-prolyl cis-trans isomerase
MRALWDLRGGAVILLIALAVGMGGCKRGSERGAASSGSREKSGTERRDGSSADADREHPIVRIDTSAGVIVVKLEGRKSLLTVNNFVQYANERYYDGMIFHQASPGYAVIGGLYDEKMAKKPALSTVPLHNEARNGLSNVRGTIAMARDPGIIDSATSGFFINLADNTSLDYRNDLADGYGYCVFGHVIEGMDVADRIGAVATHEVPAKDGPPFTGVPVEPVVIRSVRVIQ